MHEFVRSHKTKDQQDFSTDGYGSGSGLGNLMDPKGARKKCVFLAGHSAEGGGSAPAPAAKNCKFTFFFRLPP